MAAQLRSENNELRASQRDYNVLRSEVASLEHKLRLLEAERGALDEEHERKEQVQGQSMAMVERELQILRESREKRVGQQQKMARELENLQTLLREKNEDLEKCQKELLDYRQYGETLGHSRTQLAAQVDSVRRSKERMQIRVEQLLAENNQLLQLQDQSERALKDGQRRVLDLSTQQAQAADASSLAFTRLDGLKEQVPLESGRG